MEAFILWKAFLLNICRPICILLYLVKVRIINRNALYKVILLTLVWIVLREDYSAFTVVTGVIISVGCVWYARKFLPINNTSNINFLKLFLYILYLIGQVYLSGFYVIKMILFGAKAEIVEVKTKITDEALRVILSDSITLTPGSIMLDLADDKIIVLWLRGRKNKIENAEDFIKGTLEEKLLKTKKK